MISRPFSFGKRPFESTMLVSLWGLGSLIGIGVVARGRPWIDLILIVAFWMVVPAALFVTFPPTTEPGSYQGTNGFGHTLLRPIWRLLPVGATGATIGLLLSPSFLAVGLSVPWLLLMTGLAALAGRRILQQGLSPSEERAADLGWLFTAVGAGWLCAAAFPEVPIPFSRTLTQLTAVHFHIGSLTLGMGLAGLGRLLPLDAVPSTARRHTLATVTYVAGFGLVAAGITGSRPLELIGTGVLTVSVLLLVGMLLQGGRRLWAESRGVAGALLGAAGGVGIGISLALLYAWGRWPGPPTLRIPTMVATHGLLNTFGVALPLLAGLAVRSPSPRTSPSIPFSALTAPDGWTGPDFFERTGALAAADASAPRGFVADLSAFKRADFSPERLHPAVRAFYESTADFHIHVRPRWQRGWRWAGRGWDRLSTRLGQLQLPTGTHGPSDIDSRIVALSAAVDGRPSPRGWVRCYDDTGAAMYVAAYSTHSHDGVTYMNIAFPIAGGNLTSILHPTPLAVGLPTQIGLQLHTLSPPRNGDQGVYFASPNGAVPWSLRLPMDESIAVWPAEAPNPPVQVEDPNGDALVYARHDLWLLGQKYLELDYLITRREAAGLSPAEASDSSTTD